MDKWSLNPINCMKTIRNCDKIKKKILAMVVGIGIVYLRGRVLGK